MFGNGKSEIDVNIKGRDIPKITWIFIGIGILLISLGVCVSFIVRGSIGIQRAQSRIAVLEQQLQTYSQEFPGSNP